MLRILAFHIVKGIEFRCILSDLNTTMVLIDFEYSPWGPISRCDRNVSAGWAWGGPNDHRLTVAISAI